MKNLLNRKVEETKMRIHMALDYNKTMISELPDEVVSKLNAMRSVTVFMYDAMPDMNAKPTCSYVKSALAYINYCNALLGFLRRHGGIAV